MTVEIWSDVVCPFCYIGKRRFEEALQQFNQKENVEIVWRSFQLDPDGQPAPGTGLNQYLAERKGISLEEAKRMNDYVTQTAADAGLQFQLEKAIIGNTFNAHRLLHLAKEKAVQNEVKEALLKAYFTEGKNISDQSVLLNIATTAGINTDEANALLNSNEHASDVFADQQRAQQIGVRGVPFFVFNNKYAVSGAQATKVFAEVLQKAGEEEQPVTVLATDNAACAVDGSNC